MASTPRVLAFVQTPPWKSAIEQAFVVPKSRGFAPSLVVPRSDDFRVQRHLPQAKIAWALDIDDCLAELERFPESAAIIELVPSSLIRDCQIVRNVAELTSLPGLFAVGSPSVRAGLPLIWVSGFAACCFSPVRISRLTRQIESFFLTRNVGDETIEEQVQDRLPWRPLKNTN